MDRAPESARDRPLAVLDAPSNLGLRPPADGVAPGVYKLAGALREHRLLQRLGAADAGVVVPPRYRPDWDGRRTRNRDAVARYSARLADRVGALLDAGTFPVVLGGDCSILLGGMLALRRRAGSGGRAGLVFLDGHSDFRHPGNSPAVQAVAGEDLALVCGFGDPLLTDPDGLRPLVRPADVVVVGVRPDDDALPELRALGARVVTSADVAASGAPSAAVAARAHLRDRGVDRYWIHVDADVVDPGLLPAVDSPAPGGLDLAQLEDVLGGLLGGRLEGSLGAPSVGPEAAGLEVTVLDPDLDEDGEQAARLADVLAVALRRAAAPRRPRVVA